MCDTVCMCVTVYVCMHTRVLTEREHAECTQLNSSLCPSCLYTHPKTSPRPQQELHEQAHAQHTGQSTPGTSQQHTPDASSQQQQQRPQQQPELPPGVQSGDQAVPLLLLMAHPAGPFHKALAGFKTRIVAGTYPDVNMCKLQSGFIRWDLNPQP